MPTSIALHRHARQVIALTRSEWGLGMRQRAQPAPKPVASRPALPEALVDRSHWPYWPAYPGAAVGWR